MIEREGNIARVLEPTCCEFTRLCICSDYTGSTLKMDLFLQVTRYCLDNHIRLLFAQSTLRGSKKLRRLGLKNLEKPFIHNRYGGTLAQVTYYDVGSGAGIRFIYNKLKVFVLSLFIVCRR